MQCEPCNETDLTNPSLSSTNKTDKKDNFKLVTIRAKDFIYDGQECKIVTLRDMSNVRNYAKIQERKIMQLIVFGVSHEMLTPLKCI